MSFSKYFQFCRGGRSANKNYISCLSREYNSSIWKEVKSKTRPANLFVPMSVYPAQEHCEESRSEGTSVSIYFLVEKRPAGCSGK